MNQTLVLVSVTPSEQGVASTRVQPGLSTPLEIVPIRKETLEFICVLFAATLVLAGWGGRGNPDAVPGAATGKPLAGGEEERPADPRTADEPAATQDPKEGARITVAKRYLPNENNDIRADGNNRSQSVKRMLRKIERRIAVVDLGPLRLSTPGLFRRNAVFFSLSYRF